MKFYVAHSPGLSIWAPMPDEIHPDWTMYISKWEHNNYYALSKPPVINGEVERINIFETLEAAQAALLILR